MKVEWLGQVRWEGERWASAGRWQTKPTDAELRGVAWNKIGLRTKGSPYPVEVRAIKVTYEAQPPIPFREEQ